MTRCHVVAGGRPGLVGSGFGGRGGDAVLFGNGGDGGELFGLSGANGLT
ncbi:hypothetical protein [Mycobacterium asiaticum]|nr:hypothetical protein [Mycobacterium asiaticum]